jgi:transposase
MALFFKYISLSRKLNNYYSNYIHYEIGGSYSFNNPKLYTKFGFSYQEPKNKGEKGGKDSKNKGISLNPVRYTSSGGITFGIESKIP